MTCAKRFVNGKLSDASLFPVNNFGHTMPNITLSAANKDPICLDTLECIALEWRIESAQQTVEVASAIVDHESTQESMTVCLEKGCTLDGSLRMFSEPEKLSGDEAW